MFILSFSECSLAETATHNLKTQAESFELYRRITAINNQTDKVIFEMEGFLNYENESDGDLSITERQEYYLCEECCKKICNFVENEKRGDVNE